MARPPAKRPVEADGDRDGIGPYVLLALLILIGLASVFLHCLGAR